jgi:hypothetical protein
MSGLARACVGFSRAEPRNIDPLIFWSQTDFGSACEAGIRVITSMEPGRGG